jgi:hypothetical protein
MPSIEQILAKLGEVANEWKMLAVFWHVYFGAIIIALAVGKRPKKKPAGLLLALPLLSVSAIAWISDNPFNGAVFALAGAAVAFISMKLKDERVQVASLPLLMGGAVLFAFGWIYPHFLETASFLPYLYAAPVGLIPCATLIVVIGLALILDGLGSRVLSWIFVGLGLFYGLTGVFRLSVRIDWVLVLAALILLRGPALLKGRSSGAAGPIL